MYWDELAIPRLDFWAADSAWRGHVPFALTLVRILRPQVIVELGTHRGHSYLAFCQAVKQSGIDARCWAVDTWQGDEHSGRYGEEVFAELRDYHQPRYAAFSTLLRSDFDAARGQFADGSIDLLHIDGLHTYEAVRHDFDTWLPKMSSRGVILLHDIHAHLPGFGVDRLWAEIAPRYPSLEFSHSFGLGVVCVGDTPPPRLGAWCNDRLSHAPLQAYFQRLAEMLDAECALARQPPVVAPPEPSAAPAARTARLSLSQIIPRELRRVWRRTCQVWTPAAAAPPDHSPAPVTRP